MKMNLTKPFISLVLLVFLALNTTIAQEEHTVLREADITLHRGLLQQEKIELRLFDDLKIIAQKAFVDVHPQGSKVWVGKLKDEAKSAVILAHTNDTFWGKIEIPNQDLILIRTVDRKLKVQQLSITPIDEECNHLKEQARLEEEPEEEDHIQRSQVADVCLSTSTCAPQTIDLLIVYTPAARTDLGGSDAAAQSAIAAAVSEMNLINANSGVSHSFALAHSQLVSYTESGSFSTDLNSLKFPNDGFLDEIYDMRDEYYADAVAMVLASGGCGLGNVNSNSIQYESMSAFSVVSDGCLTTNKSLAHEVGHNLGFRHDRYAYTYEGDPLPSIVCDWGWGWVNPDAQTGSTSDRWRTIMAYNQQCSDWGFNCSRQNYWSNPNLTIGGDPIGSAIGNADEAHIEYLFERAACQFAEFRVPIVCSDCEVYQSCEMYNANTSSGPGNTTVINMTGSFESANSTGTAPEVCIYYYGDNSGSSEQFNVIDENGNTLGQTVASFDCDIPTRVCFTLAPTTYNSWISDNNVTITLDPIGTSINPSFCTVNRACVELVVYDISVASCFTNLSVNNNPIPNGIYEASSDINSASTVAAGGNVIFSAGKQICLDEGFEVILGAVFEAYIQGCTPLIEEIEEQK